MEDHTMFYKLISSPHTDPQQDQIRELMNEIRGAIAYTFTASDLENKADRATKKNKDLIKEETSLLSRIYTRLFSRDNTTAPERPDWR